MQVNRRVAFRKYDNPQGYINGEELNIEEKDDNSITMEDIQDMRGNTATFIRMYSKLDDSALISQSLSHIGQCGLRDINTYQDSLIQLIIPEFISRMVGKPFNEITTDDIMRMSSKT